MVEVLPKWAMKRYCRLWRKFKNKSFSHEDASKFLKESKPAALSLVIQELKRSGWIEVSFDPHNSRRRLYRLIEPEKAVVEIGKS